MTIESSRKGRESKLVGEFGSPLSRIDGYDRMEPFLMSLVSDSDLWMYVSSLGSLSAGRIDANHSVFPYCTEDVIHRSAGKTGPTTTFRLADDRGGFRIWQPFSDPIAPESVRRALMKGVLGDCIVFEERNDELGLVFRYRWSSCDEYGFVRTSEISNESGGRVVVDVLDGVLNIVAAGIDAQFLQRMSVLSDAYTECAIDAESGLCTVSLASLILDKPEPGEALRASVAWAKGLENGHVLLSEDQRRAFLRGDPTVPEGFMRGRRSNFLVSASLSIEAGESRTWDIAVDADRSQAQVEALRVFLLSDTDHRAALRSSMEAGTERLARLVASADGRSCSADQATDRHQEACVLFNIMRGGIYASGQVVPAGDFRSFVATRNHAVADRHRAWLDGLPESLVHADLLDSAAAQNDSQLLRIAYEYLPLTFSRRHGDPSRPWNFFSIRLKNQDGSPLLAYEGNWRDIFQNWEALSLSYPRFLESIVAKFVNASTVDGHNPYRITREGVDWETPDPNDPWTSIGYWGDHQIVYLLKLLELADRTSPESLGRLLPERMFSYANVPLRLRPYADMVASPKSTIDFDFELNLSIERRISEVGTDARLLEGADGDVYLVSLAEKLLVPALAKLSNLVLDGGIWMNTQRPEWNDANNALVGNGISMVTLCYLRRYLEFLRRLIDRVGGVYPVSSDVAGWLERVLSILESRRSLLTDHQPSPEGRRELLDALGVAFSDYREKVYGNGLSGSEAVAAGDIVRLCDEAIPYLDHSIRANLREDGLYHSYNILDLHEEEVARVTPLTEMLEGQVAVLSAGVLEPAEVDRLIRALFESEIYREDQETFMLYPDEVLPRFLEKNVVPNRLVDDNPLLRSMLETGDGRIVSRDMAGNCRFAPEMINASALKRALDGLESDPRWGDLAARHRKSTLDAYESVFNHRYFTGRSRSMYGYEGLGSIYWHMVSKLLVAIGECFVRAEKEGAERSELKAIADGYYRVWNGMGFNKSPQRFGAFPSDPYSHTPGGRGAKQPGMTGQTKEDILARWMELGVSMENGCIGFHPSMLRRSAFLSEPQAWSVYDLDGRLQVIDLPQGSLGFTVCGVPVVYRLGQRSTTTVATSDGRESTTTGEWLSEGLSDHVFGRTGVVRRITVDLRTEDLLAD